MMTKSEYERLTELSDRLNLAVTEVYKIRSLSELEAFTALEALDDALTALYEGIDAMEVSDDEG